LEWPLKWTNAAFLLVAAERFAPNNGEASILIIDVYNNIPAFMVNFCIAMAKP
jgi:hypothetical protein